MEKTPLISTNPANYEEFAFPEPSSPSASNFGIFEFFGFRNSARHGSSLELGRSLELEQDLLSSAEQPLSPATAPSSQKKLKTIDGVFYPTWLSIWGILVFVRLSYCIGIAGIFNVLAMICLGFLIALLTGLSISAISTNGTVRGGGPYFLLSRTLGVEFGGYNGVILCISNILANAMNVFGFVETLLDDLPMRRDSSFTGRSRIPVVPQERKDVIMEDAEESPLNTSTAQSMFQTPADSPSPARKSPHPAQAESPAKQVTPAKPQEGATVSTPSASQSAELEQKRKADSLRALKDKQLKAMQRKSVSTPVYEPEVEIEAVAIPTPVPKLTTKVVQKPVEVAKSEEEVEEEEEEELAEGFSRCEHCRRTFGTDRVARHENVCASNPTKKARKVFDGTSI